MPPALACESLQKRYGATEAGLHGLTEETGGVTGVIVQLGPFGGAQDAGAAFWVWAFVYLGLIGDAARAAFARRDI